MEEKDTYIEFWEEWQECDYCSTFGKTYGFHLRDRNKDIHRDKEWIHGYE